MTDSAFELERSMMDDLARGLDSAFNGRAKGADRKVAFVLLVAKFGQSERGVNYASNAQRDDILPILREVVARFEGRVDPEPEGIQ